MLYLVTYLNNQRQKHCGTGVSISVVSSTVHVVETTTRRRRRRLQGVDWK